MAGITTRTGSRLGFRILLALLLVAVLAVPAMAHYGRAGLGIDAIGITSATRISHGRAVVKGTVTCSKTTGGVEVWAGVRQVAGRTNTVSGYGGRIIRCVAGTKVPFSVTVTAEQGKFVGGNALVQAGAYKEVESYNPETDAWHYHWDETYTEREMKLSR